MFKQSVFSKEESNDSQSHILQFVTKFPSWKLEVFWKSVTLQDFFFHLKLANTSFVEHGSLDRNGLWHHRILQVFFWTLNKNKDEQKYTWYTPWKSSDQTSRMVFSMIHIKDSRSYQWAKFGRLGLPGHTKAEAPFFSEFSAQGTMMYSANVDHASQGFPIHRKLSCFFLAPGKNQRELFLIPTVNSPDRDPQETNQSMVNPCMGGRFEIAVPHASV